MSKYTRKTPPFIKRTRQLTTGRKPAARHVPPPCMVTFRQPRNDRTTCATESLPLPHNLIDYLPVELEQDADRKWIRAELSAAYKLMPDLVAWAAKYVESLAHYAENAMVPIRAADIPLEWDRVIHGNGRWGFERVHGISAVMQQVDAVHDAIANPPLDAVMWHSRSQPWADEARELIGAVTGEYRWSRRDRESAQARLWPHSIRPGMRFLHPDGTAVRITGFFRDRGGDSAALAVRETPFQNTACNDETVFTTQASKFRSEDLEKDSGPRLDQHDTATKGVVLQLVRERFKCADAYCTRREVYDPWQAANGPEEWCVHVNFRIVAEAATEGDALVAALDVPMEKTP